MNITIPDSWLREYLETDAKPEDIKEYLSLCGLSVEKLDKIDSEILFDIEITTNRIDAASIIGVAREATAILPRFGKKASLKQTTNRTLRTTNNKDFPLKIIIKDNLCSRVTAVVIDNINIKQPPEKVKKRLEMIGIRSLNNVVDATNYVMHEIGHPAHVFDYDKISKGEFLIRSARKGEKIVSLDNKHYTLHGGEVVIDNGKGVIIDLPGIIGTANSVVDNNTKRVLFFIDDINPVKIRRASMSLGIRTVAASYNEKGVDPELAKTAIYKGIEFLKNWAGGKVSSSIFDYYPKPYKEKKISVSKQKAFQYLNTKLSDKEIKAALLPLGFNITTTNDEITATIPSFRSKDIQIPEDIIEELARIYGYHNIKPALPTGDIPPMPKQKNLIFEKKIKQALKYWGYTETYSYSFVSKKEAEQSGYSLNQHLKINNPLTKETTYMRRSLFPSLLDIVSQNQTRKKKLFLFELAKIYHPQKGEKLPKEQKVLVIFDQESFLNLKGIIENLFDETGISNVAFEEDIHECMDSYKTAVIKKDKDILGFVGYLNTKLTHDFAIKNQTFIAEIDFEKLSKLASIKKHYKPISKYPSVIEDLTFTLEKKTPVGIVIKKLQKSSTFVEKVNLTGIYKQNYTFTVEYHHKNKSLSDSDIKPIRKKIVSSLKKEFKARLVGSL